VSTTETQVVEALRPVQDPELRRSIVDLDMVAGVAIDGGSVTVTVALTVPSRPRSSAPSTRRSPPSTASTRWPSSSPS
jgi:ATP-binding protein involved in chromosome partitioning